MICFSSVGAVTPSSARVPGFGGFFVFVGLCALRGSLRVVCAVSWAASCAARAGRIFRLACAAFFALAAFGDVLVHDGRRFAGGALCLRLEVRRCGHERYSLAERFSQ